jgi:Nidogen-like
MHLYDAVHVRHAPASSEPLWHLTGGSPARVGFNGGNGTGFWELAPFSKDTRLAQIDERSNIDYTGRYIFRIDEIIQPAGCVEGVYRKFP